MTKTIARDNFSCSVLPLIWFPRDSFWFTILVYVLGAGGGEEAEEYNSRFVLDFSKTKSLPSVGQGMNES